MKVGHLTTTAALSIALLVAGPAFAAPTSSAAPRDPNAKVCQTIPQIGSRLGAKKICATRAEWEEIRKRDREVTEDVQRSARVGCGVAPSSSHSGAPTC